MKKLLLTSIAALFLATGTAQASPIYKWQCGKHAVTIQYKPPWQTSDGESFYAYIQFEPRFPSDDIHFKWDRNKLNVKEIPDGDWPTYTGGKAWLNGKRCKVYVPGKTKSDA